MPSSKKGVLYGGIVGSALTPFSEKIGNTVGKAIEKGCHSILKNVDNSTIKSKIEKGNDIIDHLNDQVMPSVNEKLNWALAQHMLKTNSTSLSESWISFTCF